MKKHILIFPKWYPSHNYSSAGIFVKRHALSVASHVNISILYLEADSQIKKWEIKRSFEKEDGLDTLRYYYPKTILSIGFLDKVIKLILYFYCAFQGFLFLRKKKNKIDLIHVTVLLRTGIFAYFIQFFYKIPYIITEHWTGYLELTNDYKNSFYRKFITPSIIKNARLISPASDDLGNSMQKLGLKGKYFTVYNVVDTHLFQPNFNHQNEIKKILTVAMLFDRHKNVSGIFRVLQRLKKEGFQFEYNILGKGDDRKKLEEYRKELGLENEINFLGLQTGKEVAKHMNTSDFLMMFSNYENLPCVIAEALASGIPVVATDVGGISEMIRNERLGALVEAKDEEALYLEVKKMLGENSSFDKKYISTFAQNHFSKKVIGERLLEMYELGMSKK